MSTLIAQTSLQEQTIASASSLVKTKQMNPAVVLTGKTNVLFPDALTDDALEPQISAATEQANAELVMTQTGHANALNISLLNEENPTVGTSAEEFSTSSGQTGTESISSVGTSVGAGSIPFATMMVVGALGLSQTAFDDSTTDITGTANNDVLNGDSGNNKLIGLEGDDQLNGGGGNDTLDGGTGDNTLNGGEGSDTAIYQIEIVAQGVKVSVGLISTEVNVFVDLTDGNAFGYVNGSNLSYFNDTLTSIENVVTGNGEDDIYGSDVANSISTGSGSDNLYGYGGNDTLQGGDEGDGNWGDWIEGGAGNDYIDGGTGFDGIGYGEDAGNVTVNLSTGLSSSAGEGVDTLVGIEGVYTNDGNDLITGNNNANALDASGGSNTVYGMGGDDSLSASTYDSSTHYLDGGEGNDYITINGNSSNSSTVLGGAGHDVISIDSDGTNIIYGDAGNDSIELYGYVGSGASQNTVYGGDGNDSIQSYNSNPLYADGGADNDTLIGTAGGADSLLGGSGNDTLQGGNEGDGNLGDWLVGGAGNDYIDGGTGFDGIGYGEDAGNVTVNLSTGISSSAVEGVDTLVSIEGVYTSGGNDLITGNDNANILDASGGSNTVNGMGGDDSIYTYSYSSNTQYLDGGEGNDTWLPVYSEGIFFTGSYGDAPFANISGIEKIDLTNNTLYDGLVLTVNDVLNMTDTRNTLIIAGEVDDAVDLDYASWTFATTTQAGFDGNTYNVYTSGTATLLIDADLTVYLYQL